MSILIDLDDKRYADLVKEAVTNLPARAPSWTDHNASDPGITLLELFAWLAEMQVYGLNQITPGHYHSFLRLIGVQPAPAAPARVALSFTGPTGWEGVIPRGAALLAIAGSETFPFETGAELQVLDNCIAAIVSSWGNGFRNQTAANARDRIYFPAFGERAEPGSSLLIAFRNPLPAGRMVRLTIDLHEADMPPVGCHRDEPATNDPPVSLVWEYGTAAGFRTLALDEDATCSLTRSGHILFQAPADLTAVGSPYLPTLGTLPMIRCRLASGSYEIPPRVDAIRLNTVPAVQVRAIREEVVTGTNGVTVGNGMPGQVFTLAAGPVLPETLALRVRDGNSWQEWQRRETFDASGPGERHFLCDRTTGALVFGDGLHGRALPAGAELRADYRCCAGSRGNVAAGCGWLFEKQLPVTVTVRNDSGAGGGRDPEPLAEALRRAPLEVRVVDRAITSADFEELAISTPGLRVARARAIPLWQPGAAAEADATATVTVVVVPWSYTARPVPSPAFLRAVCNHLDRHRLVTTRVKVIPPTYARVSVRTRIYLSEGFTANEVRQRAEERLLSFLHPLTGGESGTGWPFGRAVYRTEVIAAIKEVEGVACVVETVLSGDGTGRIDPGGNLVIGQEALVYSERHEVEVSRLPSRCATFGNGEG